MKKKLLEKDIFYLSLFICICLVAFGGIIFTNKNLNKLVSSKDAVNKDNEINLVENKDDSVPTSTESKQNLEKAKEENKAKEQQTQTKSESKLNYIGTEVLRKYSDDMPSYSKTLDVWEIHKGLDIAAKDGAEIKSILDGTVKSVYSDERYGTSIELSYADGLTVIYSGIKENVSLEKGDAVKEGDCIGYVGNTTNVENEDGTHVHIEAYKNDKAINPLSLLE
ncbi:MAG: M23 family metallopeptidase [Intestinibacter bartlettii]|uniref:M23 family metallopeptidase n=1 Tax=Intestinibacter bartlettii TaxID=261299 RepID=UPI0026EF3ECB|nr:M23 family metallopeptidase [Intestinibacter bartlettii]MDO5010804.1 M23 family metallopeptidase [Intestinibacter bartlettii]